MTEYVYGLRDPRIKERRESFFYVGQTRNPRARLDAHISEANAIARIVRIAEILREGKKPAMEILQEIPDLAGFPEGFVQSQESKWIDHFGDQLLNKKRVPIPLGLEMFSRV